MGHRQQGNAVLMVQSSKLSYLESQAGAIEVPNPAP